MPLLLLLLDRQRSLWQHVKQCVGIAVVAFLVALPTLALFYLGSRADQLTTIDAPVLLAWGASLNSFITPPLIHPLPLVQSLARAIFQGDAATIDPGSRGHRPRCEPRLDCSSNRLRCC